MPLFFFSDSPFCFSSSKLSHSELSVNKDCKIGCLLIEISQITKWILTFPNVLRKSGCEFWFRPISIKKGSIHGYGITGVLISFVLKVFQVTMGFVSIQFHPQRMSFEFWGLSWKHNGKLMRSLVCKTNSSLIFLCWGGGEEEEGTKDSKMIMQHFRRQLKSWLQWNPSKKPFWLQGISSHILLWNWKLNVAFNWSW